MEHPSPEELAAYLDRRLPPEPVEAHLASCDRCQEALLLVGSLPEMGLSRRSPRLWVGAAAALLLAASALVWRQGSFPAARSTGEGERCAAAKAAPPRGLDLLLEPGAQALWDGPLLRVREGRLWVRTRKPVPVELAGVALDLGPGEFALSLLKSQGISWLLSEALAGEGAEGTLWVLEGEARIPGRTLGAGMKILLSGTGMRFQDIPSSEAQEIRSASAQAASALPGDGLFAPGLSLGSGCLSVRSDRKAPACWRWVTMLSERDAATELNVTVDVDGRPYEWTVGLAGQPPRSREVLELSWDGEYLSGRVDGKPVFSVLRQGLGKALRPAGSPGFALTVWGGSVRVLQSRLREGP